MTTVEFTRHYYHSKDTNDVMMNLLGLGHK